MGGQAGARWGMRALLALLTGLHLGACAAGEREPARTFQPEPAPLVIPPLSDDAGVPAPVVHIGPVEVVPAGPPVPARDPRMLERRPRSRALVLSDVQTAETQLASMPVSAPGRSALRKRIADRYGELAYTARGEEAVHARSEAVKHLLAIRTENASFAAMDAVLYYLGLEQEQLGDARSARVSYHDLVSRFPGSDLVPLAYFGFGELFVAEAPRDPPKYDLALQAFKEALRPPKAPIRPDALLRIAQCQLRMAQENAAAMTFLELRRTYPDSQATAQVPPGY